ncbi:molecular chaperone DnaJ [candidate division CSSED10-310 bacterium]|uniref:Chaperone protein DnaJ n=1 Tax=candidate division CSSED10-310 bacterium TaxID=2855610 RepID=A0ABV6YYQ3_UNCC1
MADRKKKNFYDILNVKKDATQKDIKNAYRKMARKWHPDVNPGNKQAERKFKEISIAYKVLVDSDKRKAYDEFGADSLRTGFDAEKARQYKQWGATSQQQWTEEPAEDFGKYNSYNDLFSDLFGFQEGWRGFEQAVPDKGRDIEYEMSLDLLSALRGLTTELSIQKFSTCSSCQGSGKDLSSDYSNCNACNGTGQLHVTQGQINFKRTCTQCGGQGKLWKTCPNCGGSGKVPALEKIKVVIPEGVHEGSKVRVAGKGEPGSNGKPAGDLYLKIHVNEHPLLQRKGDDLYMEVPITVREAVAGGTIIVPTVDGPVKVKIPSGSQSGQILKLKGKGAVNIKTKQPGSLMLKLVIKVPKTDDKSILEAVEKIDRFYSEDVRKEITL